jgi:hypothetical protein
VNYPQQNWQGYQQPGYATGFDAPRKGSPALAVISAIVALGLAGVLVWETLDLLDTLGDLTAQLPGGWTAMIVAHFVIAGLALIGAVLVFARVIAGAFILLTTGVLAIAAIVTAPLMAEGVGYTLVYTDIPTTLSPTGLYYNKLFAFDIDNLQPMLRLVALALGVILLVISALPPSLNWLRRRRDHGYSPQQAGW